MRMVIVVGDATSSGGYVITGSPQTDIDGKAVARVGDKATCPKHKNIFPIVSGDATLIVDGNAIAREGDALACGCTLVSGKQHLVLVDSGSSVKGTTNVPAQAHSPISSKPSKLTEETPEICEECILAAASKGTAFLARSA